MAHKQQVSYCESVKERFPQFFTNRLVLDIGSLDINGNNQYLFEDCLYLGIDLRVGRNVDFAARGHELTLPDASFDVIISTECLEHDMFFALTLKNILRMLKPGGLFLMSCAKPGRPEHGTRRTTPLDSPFTQELGDWGDYYKNLDEGDIRGVIDVDSTFGTYCFSGNEESHDLYFWGIKTGKLIDRKDYSFQITEPGVRAESTIEKVDLDELLAAANVQNILIGELQEKLKESNSNANNLRLILANEAEQLKLLQEKLEEGNRSAHNLRLSLADEAAHVNMLRSELKSRENQLERLIASKSWQFTKAFRFAGRLCRGEFDIAFSSWMESKRIKESRLKFAQFANGLSYLKRGDISGFLSRLRAYKQDLAVSGIRATSGLPANHLTWGVISTPHTLFVAELIEAHLKKHDFSVQIIENAVEKYDLSYYIVICPQMFDRLPPGERRIAFQMEQAVSSRWFTDDYITTLESSLAVLDYSLVNLEFLLEKGIVYPHVNYLPIGAFTDYGRGVAHLPKTHRILFYGGYRNSPRRCRMLDALKVHFQVKVMDSSFGADMIESIKRADLVINIHYYEDGLLEMPRIQECLSLGVEVVSESAQDQGDYPELDGVVRFFESGSIPAMLGAINAALENPASPAAIEKSVAASAKRFSFMFDRFLVSMGFLSAAYVNKMDLPILTKEERVALSLPETIGRRRAYEAVRPAGCAIFDGIRFRPGWIGCGLSYKALASNALARGVNRLTVMEDDVLLPSDFEEKINCINEFLALRSGEWDVFSGVIASLNPDAEILSVDDFSGIRFVTIDKMTSTVFNIYGEKSLRALSGWDPDNSDPFVNTIDRFLERSPGLKVVVTVPFFVGHREEAFSTLWGFRNTTYIDWIAASERLLIDKVSEYKRVNS